MAHISPSPTHPTLNRTCSSLCSMGLRSNAMQLIRNIATLTGVKGNASLVAQPTFLESVLRLLSATTNDYEAVRAAAETMIAMLGVSGEEGAEPFQHRHSQLYLIMSLTNVHRHARVEADPYAESCWATALMLVLRLLRLLAERGLCWEDDMWSGVVDTLAAIVKDFDCDVSDGEVSCCKP